MPKRTWSRDDIIVTLDLYFRLPSNRVNASDPEIVRVANLIGKPARSVRMAVLNFRALDPECKLPCLDNYSTKQEQVWKEFGDNRDALNSECSRITANRESGR